jgi:hypothetical protein
MDYHQLSKIEKLKKRKHCIFKIIIRLKLRRDMGKYSTAFTYIISSSKRKKRII